MISIVLIEPEWSSNVGAVARVMGNFDFKDLVLVNPICDHQDLQGVMRAKHAKSILKRAKVVDISYLDKFDYLIATTSKLGSDYNLTRSPLRLEDLASKIKDFGRKKVGIVFGREGEGLHNNEIRKCDMIVSIPTSIKYPAMNLSHSVSIVLYEIFKVNSKKKVGDQISLIGGKEKEKLIELINSKMDKMEFTTTDKRKNMKYLWKRLIGKSFLTKREAFSLFGFFRKIK